MGGRSETEIIRGSDGIVYHLDLAYLPTNVLLMGAAGRVQMVARQFDRLLYSDCNLYRPEFAIAVGMYQGVKIAAVSCGIGSGPIDIFMGEAHALWEQDPCNKQWTNLRPRINIIRVGTCATSQRDVPVGTLAISKYAIGLDAVGAFYYVSLGQRDEAVSAIEKAFGATAIGHLIPALYAAGATPWVVTTLQSRAYRLDNAGRKVESGITLACPGFFGPQGREIGRMRTRMLQDNFLEAVSSFRFEGIGIINIEMETSLLFRLAHELLGYNVGAICMVAANRMTGKMIDKEYADVRMEGCIRVALETMVELNRPQS